MTKARMPDQKIPFTAHLEELRRRLIISFIAVIAGFLVAYTFSDRIFDILNRDLISTLREHGETLQYINPTEAFFTSIKVAILAGVFLVLPIIFYQFWMFVSPGLYRKEKRMVIPFVIFSTLCFLAGASFGYFFVFPYAFKFLLGYSIGGATARPTLSSALAFVSKLLLAFGLIFELPVITFFLARIGLITHRTLTKNRRYFIVIAFIAAAALTPPDVFTQLLMAGPLIVLFEISVIVARVFGKKPLTDSKGDLVDEEEPGHPAD